MGETGDTNDRVLDAWRTRRRLGVDNGVEIPPPPPPLSLFELSSTELELIDR